MPLLFALSLVGAQVSGQRGDVAHVVTTHGAGRVDWTTRSILVRGKAAPSARLIDPVVVRQTAEQQARDDVVARALAVLKEIEVSGGRTAHMLFAKSADLEDLAHQLCKNYRVVETRYFADGGVEIDAEVRLDAGLSQALLSQSTPAAQAAVVAPRHADETVAAERLITAEASTPSIVIHSKADLAVLPCLAPQVMDAQGTVLLALRGPQDKRPGEPLLAWVTYVRSIDAAIKDISSKTGSGEKAPVLRAQGLAPASRTDLMLNADDAARLCAVRGAMTASGEELRVIFVLP